MPKKRDVGVARVPRSGGGSGDGSPGRDRGVARVPKPAEPTGVVPAGASVAPPIFVDDTGRRGRRLRWIAFLLAFAGLLAAGLLFVSQAWSSEAPAAPPASEAPATPPRPAHAAAAGTLGDCPATICSIPNGRSG